VAIDYWKLTQDFEAGDAVQRFAPGLGGLSLSPFLGMVTAVHRGLGVVDVQWPYGNERMFPDDIVRVNPQLVHYLPPSLDQSYMSYDIQKAREKWASAPRLWRTTELPAGFHVDLARQWTRGANEVSAYDDLWRKYAAFGAPDEDIRDEVGKFYLVARNLSELRVQQHVVKTATYWVAQNRQYRVTTQEIGAMKPSCPRCSKQMRKTTYKMTEGQRERLFACPKCLFLIKQEHLLGPDGQPVGW
jgi:hypothetical protein